MAPTWAEALALDGLKLEITASGSVLGDAFAAGSVAVEPEEVAPKMRIAKAADSQGAAVCRPRNNQHEGQHDVACVERVTAGDDDVVAELEVVGLKATVAAALKVQPQERTRI